MSIFKDNNQAICNESRVMIEKLSYGILSWIVI